MIRRSRTRLALFAATGAALASGCGGVTAALDPDAYAAALDDRARFRSELESSCAELGVADQVIAEAISIGAPIYNAGSPLGCFRIYEGAAYKLLVLVGSGCPELAALVRAGLGRAEADRSFADKSWTLRRTFDTVLGETTSYVEPVEPGPEEGL